jgi:hypothetical protein
MQLLQESVALTSDRSDVINTIYISRLMIKIFSIRKLMQNTDVNTLDGDNQLHPIFYSHQHFITSGKTDVRFTVISICSQKQILFFCTHNIDVIIDISIC